MKPQNSSSKLIVLENTKRQGAEIVMQCAKYLGLHCSTFWIISNKISFLHICSQCHPFIAYNSTGRKNGFHECEFSLFLDKCEFNHQWHQNQSGVGLTEETCESTTGCTNMQGAKLHQQCKMNPSIKMQSSQGTQPQRHDERNATIQRQVYIYNGLSG